MKDIRMTYFPCRTCDHVANVEQITFDLVATGNVEMVLDCYCPHCSSHMLVSVLLPIWTRN